MRVKDILLGDAPFLKETRVDKTLMGHKAKGSALLWSSI